MSSPRKRGSIISANGRDGFPLATAGMTIKMTYWLMKSEPDVFSIDDLRRKNVAGWDGVRNYQARNNLRAMRKGDFALFYHSSAKPTAIVGLMEVVREAYPDPKAANDGWVQVDVKFVKVFAHPLTLDDVK